MARARDPNRDRAYGLWERASGDIKLKDIADQLGVSENTVRGWKKKDEWERNGTPRLKKQNETQPMERIDSPVVSEIEENDLTDKQRIFILEYLRDFNITRSAIAAGYSKKAAHVVGWEVLRNPKVQAEIKRQKGLRTAELGLHVQRVIAEYMKIAFADITDILDFGQKEEKVLDDQGNPIPDPETGEPMTFKRNFVSFRNSDEIDGTVVGEVKQGKDGVTIKLHDKLRALEKLEKYLDFMTEEQRLKVEKMKLEMQSMQNDGDGEGNNALDNLVRVLEMSKEAMGDE